MKAEVEVAAANEANAVLYPIQIDHVQDPDQVDLDLVPRVDLDQEVDPDQDPKVGRAREADPKVDPDHDLVPNHREGPNLDHVLDQDRDRTPDRSLDLGQSLDQSLGPDPSRNLGLDRNLDPDQNRDPNPSPDLDLDQRADPGVVLGRALDLLDLNLEVEVVREVEVDLVHRYPGSLCLEVKDPELPVETGADKVTEHVYTIQITTLMTNHISVVFMNV